MAGVAAAPTAPSEAVLDVWRTAKIVCFDVDSTVCEDEGIDELAAFQGVGEQVAALTASAMGGGLPFETALSQRLALIRPSSSAVAAFLAQHPPRLSPGIKELVGALQARGTSVYLVSGGFTQMIHPVARLLGVPVERVMANTLLFHPSTGEFADFDRTAHTSRSGGKAAAIASIRAAHPQLHPVVMIGDGATDAEARGPGGADAFVCYGGVIARPAVAARADWFVTSFDPLISALH